MKPWDRLLDHWCYDNAGCNLPALKGSTLSPELSKQFIEFVLAEGNKMQAVVEAANNYVNWQDGSDYEAKTRGELLDALAALEEEV